MNAPWQKGQFKNKSSMNNERALCIAYKNNVLFEDLLELDKSFKTHHRNIQSLVIELYKIKNTFQLQ